MMRSEMVVIEKLLLQTAMKKGGSEVRFPANPTLNERKKVAALPSVLT